MSRKVDFDLELKEKILISDVKVGQPVLLRQEENGTWVCSREQDSSSVLGDLPPAVAATVRSESRYTAVVRSIKRCHEDPNSVSSVQIRISFIPAEQTQPLVQAEPPVEDTAGFTLTTTELERLAYNEEFRTTLKDRRLQELLLKVDGAANREQALKQALDNPDFREFADRMLGIMKPTEYPGS